MGAGGLWGEGCVMGCRKGAEVRVGCRVWDGYKGVCGVKGV